MANISTMPTKPKNRPNHKPCRPLSPTFSFSPAPYSWAMVGLSAVIIPMKVMNTVTNTELPSATAVRSSLPAAPDIAVSTTPTATAAICAIIMGSARLTRGLVSPIKSRREYWFKSKSINRFANRCRLLLECGQKQPARSRQGLDYNTFTMLSHKYRILLSVMPATLMRPLRTA